MPLYTSTTFERAADGSFPKGFEYVRDANPNRNAFESCMAALEGGCEAIAFSSGMAAIAAMMEAHVAGRCARIVLPVDMYFGIRSLITDTDLGQRFEFITVDMTDLDQVRAVVSSGRPTLVWIETPSNPLINVVDIEAVTNLAHSAGAIVVVDNTWGTPALQRPLAFGADAVVHSATKYIGGHSDLMLGVVVLPAGSNLGMPLRAIQKHKGSVPSPFDCWLALRGIQTLSLRMKAHSANALAVAKALSAASEIETVLYPGLPHDPGHGTASRQMSAFGGMLSLIVCGGAKTAVRLTGAVKIVTRATSLGGTHTLIEHRASIEGPETKAPPGLLRISVGLEHPDDIIDDLRNALDVATAD